MAGYPQGGVLSPALWCSAVDSQFFCLSDNGVSCLGYDDDLVIIPQGKYDGSVSDIMNNVIL